MTVIADDVLKRPEGRTLEFKRDLSALRAALKTIVAFANTAGGTLVIGRDDDGRVGGLVDAKKDGERLADAVAESIAPALLPDIEQVDAGGRELLVVHVARWPGPFYLKAEGPETGVYIRLGSTTRRADPTVVAAMKRADASLAFDQAPCLGAELADIDIDAAELADVDVLAAFADLDEHVDPAPEVFALDDDDIDLADLEPPSMSPATETISVYNHNNDDDDAIVSAFALDDGDAARAAGLNASVGAARNDMLDQRRVELKSMLGDMTASADPLAAGRKRGPTTTKRK